MDFVSIVEGRRSIRRYLSDPVPESDIIEIVSLATKAPSAGNRQMWQFYIVANPDVRSRMKEEVLTAFADLNPALSTTGYTFFADAPVAIAIVGERYRSRVDEELLVHGLPQHEVDELRQRPDLQSLGGMIQTLLLAAHARGYGTCWLTGPNLARPGLERILGVQEPHYLAAIVSLGVPAEAPTARPRKPVEEVVRFLR